MANNISKNYNYQQHRKLVNNWNHAYFHCYNSKHRDRYLRPPERGTGSSVRGSSKSQKNWEIFNIENRVRASGPTTDEWAQLRLGVAPEINVYGGAVKAPVYVMRMMTGARFQRMRRAERVAQKRISSDKKHQTPPCKFNQQYWCFDLIIPVTYFGCDQNPQNCIRKASCILETFAPARQTRVRWSEGEGDPATLCMCLYW